jgi:hypothetical protein
VGFSLQLLGSTYKVSLGWSVNNVLFFVYVIIGIGIVYFIWTSYYYFRSGRKQKKELSSIIFVIILGLAISILLTVDLESVPETSSHFNKKFDNMSISVDYKSPFIIPVNTLNNPIHNKTKVTIYNNDSNFQIESVKMGSPINSIFSSPQTSFTEDKNKSSNGKHVYFADISASHNGEIYNKTQDYTTVVYYFDLRNATKPSIECDKELPITSVMASKSQQNNPKHFAVDRNSATRWSNLGSSWLTLDLGSQNNVCSLKILWFKGHERQYIFDVSISNDSKSFTKLFSGRSSGGALASEQYDVKDANARFLRISSNGSLVGGIGNNYVSINETNIVGNNLSSLQVASTDFKNKLSLYENMVTFPWNVRISDLSLLTYFWIVMAGVVASRFLDFILRGLSAEDEIRKKMHDEVHDLIDGVPSKDDKDYSTKIQDFEKNKGLHKEHLEELSKMNTYYKDRILQSLQWKDLLWIIFSFFIAVLLFSTFKQNVILSSSLLINISLAFGFGFTFDRTLEMATRFKPIFTSDLNT